MQVYKAALFGGALMSAGLSSQAIAGPEFAVVPSYSISLFAQAYDTYVSPISDSAFGSSTSFDESLTASIPGTSATASLTSSTMSAYANATDNQDVIGSGYAVVTGRISVSADASLELAWDFRAENVTFFPPVSELAIIDLSTGESIFQTTTRSAGSTSIDVLSGDTYLITLSARAYRGGISFATATLVPTPGAVSALAIAGLVATRRRR